MRAYSLSSRLMENYLRQPYPWFLNRNSAHLSKVILVEVQRVVNEAIMPVMLVLSQFVLVLSLFGLLLVVEPTIALLAVVLFGGSYVAGLHHRPPGVGPHRQRRPRGERRALQVGARSDVLIKDVKILGVEKTFLDRFRKPTGEMAVVQSRGAVIGEAPRSILQALALAGMLVLILHLLVSRSGSLNDIMPTLGVFAFAGLRLFPALQMIYRQLGTLKVTKPAVDELFADMMETEAKADALAEGSRPPCPSTSGSSSPASAMPIRRPAVPRCRASTSPSPPAASIGIVGGTGAGKTTLVDIMLGLLWPDEGGIRVDGVPVTRDNLRAWQKNIGYVPQQIFAGRRHGRRQHRLRHPGRADRHGRRGAGGAHRRAARLRR